jgi:hypothetical protein
LLLSNLVFALITIRVSPLKMSPIPALRDTLPRGPYDMYYDGSTFAQTPCGNRVTAQKVSDE